MDERRIKAILECEVNVEGAGVIVRRAFSRREAEMLDPFLLLDYFGSNDPDEYIKGFPWHPHRGIETITYMFKGKVKHEDSLGNVGVINPGEIQWMTAGSGIIHQEMPDQARGTLHGFQLWLNLPARQKMRPPRYRDVHQSDIPEVQLENGIRVKVIAGEFKGVQGAVQDIIVMPTYLDVTIPPETTHRFTVPRDHTALNYIVKGEARFGQQEKMLTEEHVVVHESGATGMTVTTENKPVRLLLLAAMPLREPIAWQGPIVMNTPEQIYQAIMEYNTGRFIKHEPSSAPTRR